MMLSDRTIRRLVNQDTIGFSPEINDGQYQPASIDLRLGHQFRVMEKDGDVLYTVPRRISDTHYVHWITAVPGVPILAHTLEEISLPEDIVARVEGKSTWARKFLLVHMTAGFVDPGFIGQITLEILNLGIQPIDLYPGDMICQVSFEMLDQTCDRPYGNQELGSRYQGQRGPTPAREYPPLSHVATSGVTIKPEELDLPVKKYDGGPVIPSDLIGNDGNTIA